MQKKIDQYIISRVKDAADIVDVVGDFVTLKKSGVRWLGLCPFHDDRHLGSFVVYPRKNIFKCFKCEAKGGPVEFVMRHEHLGFADAIRWLGKKYSIETDMEDFNYTPPPPRKKAAPLPTLALPMWMVERKARLEGDTLVGWIREGIQWDSVQRRRIDDVLAAYRVGHSTIVQRRRDGSEARHDFTIFWQIDDKGVVRTGHMMKYKPDGHRVKREDDRYCTDWVHAVLSGHRQEGPWPWPQYYDPDRQEMRQTLFGMHLVDRYGPTASVHIVESEKTALLMAIAYGNHRDQVWMACGGVQNLSRERLKPLIDRRRHIVLYPDRDGIALWRQKAESLHYDNVGLYEDPVTKWWRPVDGQKADIADVVVRMVNERGGRAVAVGDIIDGDASLSALRDKLNLEIIDEDNGNR